MGKALSKVNSMARIQSFEPIPQLEPLVSLPDHMYSQGHEHGQHCLLQIGHECGVLEAELASRLAGSLCHSRWLNTGQSYLLLHMSANLDLDDKQERTLHLITKWVA